ncbi:MAG: hypothetical protein AMS24_04100 [Chlamydiae bacterium SM23_39]|nr:MAG: hypothetical protein AMS24_04100 [Chlamydiae bacterium SM23_39]
MKIKNFFLFSFMLIAVSIFADKISDIDKEIQSLEETKRGLESEALRFEDKAQRLQFQENRLQDAKKFWRMAEVNREAAKKIDEEIKRKQSEKEKLMKK